MRRIRVIPALLLQNDGLVKTVNFKEPKYVGDPINAVKIFNEKEVDELIFLDINATQNTRPPQFDKIGKIAGECFMPLAYGGGITTIEQIKNLFNCGVEKVVVNTSAYRNPDLIRNASGKFGSQSVVVSVDVKKGWLGKRFVYVNCGKTNTAIEPLDYAVQMQQLGAGELFLNSIDREGTYKGYDIELIKKVSAGVDIPVIASGGARNVDDFAEAAKGGASAVSAGSMFVFYGKHRAVLINFPSQEELMKKLYILQ